jgi:hypothetical protein
MRENQLKTPNKKYIEVLYSPVTQGYLQEYCLDQGFDISQSFSGNPIAQDEFDFHTTVWYTTNEVVINNKTYNINIDDVKPLGFELFGDNRDILVLEIDSEQIRSIRSQLGTEYSLQDQWPDYRPHITLSYKYVHDDIPQIDLPDGEQLVGTELKIKDQRKD